MNDFSTWLSALNHIYGVCSMRMIDLDLLTFMNTLISQNNKTKLKCHKMCNDG